MSSKRRAVEDEGWQTTRRGIFQNGISRNKRPRGFQEELSTVKFFPLACAEAAKIATAHATGMELERRAVVTPHL
jgi:hypothetical protein